VLATPGLLTALTGSAVLGVSAALTGTTLALAAAWTVERAPTRLASAVGVLARVPVVVPGAVAGAGWLLAVGEPPAGLGGALVLLVPPVACWSLPLLLDLARRGLVLADPAGLQAAMSLGAGPSTTLRRIVVPALRPVVGWMLAVSFAGGLLALDVVAGLLGPGNDLATLSILALAAGGALGQACAVATVLLAAAGGAMLLGRALAGRTGPTLLA
jgi:ABC-type Fe3+ transport system permease subunit